VTVLDEHAAHLSDRLAAIAAEPAGPVARQVRDDLRRAHPVGVARNEAAVRDLLRALPPTLLDGCLSHRSPNRDTYLRMLGRVR